MGRLTPAHRPGVHASPAFHRVPLCQGPASASQPPWHCLAGCLVWATGRGQLKQCAPQAATAWLAASGAQPPAVPHRPPLSCPACIAPQPCRPCTIVRCDDASLGRRDNTQTLECAHIMRPGAPNRNPTRRLPTSCDPPILPARDAPLSGFRRFALRSLKAREHAFVRSPSDWGFGSARVVTSPRARRSHGAPTAREYSWRRATTARSQWWVPPGVWALATPQQLASAGSSWASSAAQPRAHRGCSRRPSLRLPPPRPAPAPSARHRSTPTRPAAFPAAAVVEDH